jgi:tRNA (mo5U34)-methyltransferase
MPPDAILDWPDLQGLDTADADTLRSRVERVPSWFHTMDLGQGVRTRGTYDAAAKLDRLHLPARLDGTSVLDVGAWDGFYSFECARRGASSVLSADLWTPPVGASREGYAVARAARGRDTRAIRVGVHDPDPAIHGVHALVLFLGVLYHLKNPLEALERIRAVTSGLAIVETESDLAFTRRPALAFYERDELAGDPTNWFAPNAHALVAMCRAAGFREVRVVYSMGLATRAGRALSRTRKFKDGFLRGLSCGRIVAHATV